MKTSPIIFSGPMMLAILEGRKTQTRRLKSGAYRYGEHGDRLWVRETLVGGKKTFLRYAADDKLVSAPPGQMPSKWQHTWRKDYGEKLPAIYMPRWASRITLEVTSVRAERLQDITEEDAKAEGFPLPGPIKARQTVTHEDGHVESSIVDLYDFTARGSFAHLWDGINGKRAPWATNPEVWVISFKRADAASSEETGT